VTGVNDLRWLLSSVALSAGLSVAQAAQLQLSPVKHVLLISVDGLHQQDLALYVRAHPKSAMANLAAQGLTYTGARSGLPSDSFPGLLALITGGTPRSTGVYYDDSYDRLLAAPGSDCKVAGTELLYDESIDKNPDVLDGGGGIDPLKLPRDPARGCAPVYPHSALRVNTIFEVAHTAGLKTAWADKHPSYDLMRGPSGTSVDDLYTPEINAGGTTGSEAKTAAYDALKVKAVLSQLGGLSSDGQKVGVPAVLGMNFQALSVAQKTKGYLDAAATPTPDVSAALDFVDASLGQMQATLKAQNLSDSTLIIVTAKHGQSPIDPRLRRVVDSKALAAAITAAAAKDVTKPGSLAQLTADTVGLVWLRGGEAQAVSAALMAQKEALGIDRIIVGAELRAMFGDPATDSRAPDLIVIPQLGVIYTKPTSTKIAEHGGFSDDDSRVALLLSGPGYAGGGTVSTPVSTTQVAPTILQALGLDPRQLQAVLKEGTPVLPLR
jgi:Type I phosphodiesterase / nucleotide pyrophosphatase